MAGRHWNTRNLKVGTTPGLVPPGLIIMWAGSQVPAGWALCDGQNGTPDLRDRFIVGAGRQYSVGATGGVASHSHGHAVGPHGTSASDHNYMDAGPGMFNEFAARFVHGHSFAGGTDPAVIDNRPPYYALAFIQKMPYQIPGEGVHYNEANLTDATGLLPRGAILAWSGAVSSIPPGWFLCDGQNGTPDLRDRFVVGAGASYPVGATGGQVVAAHRHRFRTTTGGPSVNELFAISNWYAVGHPNHYHAIDVYTDEASPDNRPPFYALAFIMRG